MFGRDSKPAARIDTLIGRTTHVEGGLRFSGGLHVDGRIGGNVTAQGAGSSLSVGEHGVIEGKVETTHLTLNGVVKGDIRAPGKVALGAQAKVHGNLYYGVIEMTLGAEIAGKLVPVVTK